MGFETEIMKGFDDYCREKRNAIAKISNEEKRAGQEKVLVARSLLHHEAQQMAARYAKQEDSNAALFGELQEATVSVLSAGLEDTSFNKWKANLTDTVMQVLAAEQMKRLPPGRSIAAVPETINRLTKFLGENNVKVVEKNIENLAKRD